MIATCNSDNYDSGKHHESMYVHIYIQLPRDITYKCMIMHDIFGSLRCRGHTSQNCVLSTFPMYHDLNTREQVYSLCT
jgi:hypothetical protein